MPSTDWPPEHCQALREFFAGGESFAGIARAINAKFNTGYSRSAVIGRTRRMGLIGSARSGELPRPQRTDAPRLRLTPDRRPWPLMPDFEKSEPVKLRCVAIEPRHLSFLELERDDCRYPYGGDAEDEAITFCGHPARPGSSYCTPHFHLTRKPKTPAERVAGTAALRLVTAA
jgi:GcrA cell cycle regulator